MSGHSTGRTIYGGGEGSSPKEPCSPAGPPLGRNRDCDEYLRQKAYTDTDPELCDGLKRTYGTTVSISWIKQRKATLGLPVDTTLSSHDHITDDLLRPGLLHHCLIAQTPLARSAQGKNTAMPKGEKVAAKCLQRK